MIAYFQMISAVVRLITRHSTTARCAASQRLRVSTCTLCKPTADSHVTSAQVLTALYYITPDGPD